jgi:hypothetical protein
MIITFSGQSKSLCWEHTHNEESGGAHSRTCNKKDCGAFVAIAEKMNTKFLKLNKTCECSFTKDMDLK